MLFHETYSTFGQVVHLFTKCWYIFPSKWTMSLLTHCRVSWEGGRGVTLLWRVGGKARCSAHFRIILSTSPSVFSLHKLAARFYLSMSVFCRVLGGCEVCKSLFSIYLAQAWIICLFFLQNYPTRSRCRLCVLTKWSEHNGTRWLHYLTEYQGGRIVSFWPVSSSAREEPSRKRHFLWNEGKTVFTEKANAENALYWLGHPLLRTFSAEAWSWV